MDDLPHVHWGGTGFTYKICSRYSIDRTIMNQVCKLCTLIKFCTYFLFVSLVVTALRHTSSTCNFTFSMIIKHTKTFTILCIPKLTLFVDFLCLISSNGG